MEGKSLMGSQDDNLRTPTVERMKALATVKTAAEKLKSTGAPAAEFGQEERVCLDTARSIVDRWPEAPKMTATQLLEHYGPPHEATPSKLFWYQTGPWTRMELTADHVLHNFPTPHVDYFTQFVSYPVPPRRQAIWPLLTAASSWTGPSGSWVPAVTMKPSTPSH